MTTGQRIKAARKKVNMTQAELAQRLNIPYQSIGQWERDIRKPKYETLKRIADALRINVYDLAGPPFEPDSTGGRIERCRVDAGLSQQDLADQCGVSLLDVCKYEAGTAYPSLETLKEIADVLGVTVDYLRGRTLKRNLVAFTVEQLERQVQNTLQENELLNIFSKLNEEGQQKAIERVEELTEIPKYQKAKEPPQPE